MRVVLISDTHLRHERGPLDIPEGDLLVHAGDALIGGDLSELMSFGKWIKAYSVSTVNVSKDVNARPRTLHGLCELGASNTSRLIDIVENPGRRAVGHQDIQRSYLRGRA